MTAERTWHLDDAVLDDYVGAHTDAARASSVEQHVLRCGECRDRVNVRVRAAGTRQLDDVWLRLADDLQSPPPALVERLLTMLGLPADEALILWSAPTFRAPWLSATLVTLAFATLAAGVDDGRGLLLFLVVAPLLPVAGVAFAYGPLADPSFEITASTPYSALRLLLLRTVAVLATTLPLTVAAGLLVPGGGLGVAWLAPSLAAVAATLAAATWIPLARAAAAASLTWAGVVVLAAGPALLSPSSRSTWPACPAT